jgi:hypothetical protein
MMILENSESERGEVMKGRVAILYRSLFLLFEVAVLLA